MKNPVELFVQNLRFRTKFAFVFVLACVGMGILGFSITADRTATVATLEREKEGLVGWRPMLEAIQQQQRSRGLSAAWNGGDASAKDQMLSAMSEVDTTLPKAKAGVADFPETRSVFNEWVSRWQKVREGVGGEASSGLPKLHTDSIATGLKALGVLSMESGLMFEADPAANLQQLILFEDIPKTIEYYGHFRALGTAINATHELTPEAKERLLVIELRLNASLERLVGRLNDLERMGDSSVAAMARDYKTRVSERVGFVNKMIVALRQGQFSEPKAFFNEITGVIDRAYLFSFEKLFPVLQKTIDVRLSDARRQRGFAIATIMTILGVMVLLFWSMGSNVLKQVFAIQHAAQALARGDLTQRPEASGKDELSQAIVAFADGIDKLHGVFNEFRRAIVEIDEQSESLASSSSQVAAASASQADNVAQVAATVEEMSAGVDSLASSAGSACESARHSEVLSVQGGDIVARTVKGIGAIANRVEDASIIIERLGTESAKISTIVETIKEIADQTNLLALNAAIEAARAGESGRGFAVVADEVRKLAERTGGATEEISLNITHIQSDILNAVEAMKASVSDVSAGVESAERSGAAMGEIHERSMQVQQMVNDISSSLKEQSTAAHQVAQNIEALAQISEENHAAAESTKGATNILRERMLKLEARMSSFRL